ncbi:hypothetical protein K8R62_03715 [bacterium]|nr:hypothetical protein [bacterium]
MSLNTKTCKNCLINNQIPSVGINNNGPCSYCESHSKQKDFSYKEKISARNNFDKIINKTILGKRNKYDVLLMLSGGKDSSYILNLLKKQYKLNVLACSVMRPLLNSKALDNIVKITKKLKVDFEIYPFEEKFYRNFLGKGLVWGYKNNMGPSIGCQLCCYLKDTVCFNIALKNGVKIIVSGWDKSQSSSPIIFFKEQDKKEYLENQYGEIYRLFLKLFPEYRNTIYDLNLDSIDYKEFPSIISPLTFIDYSIDLMYKELEKIGFSKHDFSPLKTNCDALEFFNYLSYSYYGSHINTMSISREIRKNGFLKINNKVLEKKRFKKFY